VAATYGIIALHLTQLCRKLYFFNIANICWTTPLVRAQHDSTVI